MPTALEAPATFAPPPHKLWTRDECGRLALAGINLDRYELIAGELLLKMPKGYLHMLPAQLLIRWLRKIFDEGQILQEPSIDVYPEDCPTNAPEPDAVVLKRQFSELDGPPGPSELLLAVEVSKSTLAFHLKAKASLYARSSIPEYWVLDVEARRVIVHRKPNGDRYSEVAAFAAGEFVACLAAPEEPIRVEDLFKS